MALQNWSSSGIPQTGANLAQCVIRLQQLRPKQHWSGLARVQIYQMHFNVGKTAQKQLFQTVHYLMNASPRFFWRSRNSFNRQLS